MNKSRENRKKYKKKMKIRNNKQPKFNWNKLREMRKDKDSKKFRKKYTKKIEIYPRKITLSLKALNNYQTI